MDPYAKPIRELLAIKTKTHCKYHQILNMAEKGSRKLAHPGRVIPSHGWLGRFLRSSLISFSGCFLSQRVPKAQRLERETKTIQRDYQDPSKVAIWMGGISGPARVIYKIYTAFIPRHSICTSQWRHRLAPQGRPSHCY